MAENDNFIETFNMPKAAVRQFELKLAVKGGNMSTFQKIQFVSNY